MCVRESKACALVAVGFAPGAASPTNKNGGKKQHSGKVPMLFGIYLESSPNDWNVSLFDAVDYFCLSMLVVAKK